MIRFKKPFYRIYLAPEFQLSGRLLLLSVAVGVAAGLGAILFFYLMSWGDYLFMNRIIGYLPPVAGGEDFAVGGPPSHPPIRWLFLIVPALGGLLSGLIVYNLAPEAEGDGTDAVAEAFHHRRGIIRFRVPFIKMISSIITISSGGSAGREGPIMQIGAGFGSYLASKLKLSDEDRRILLIAGTSGGIGAIFRSPLGGAIFGAEVLYHDDFEAQGLVPSLVSSIVAYSIFCSVFGWGALFEMPDYFFHTPMDLIFYAIFGVLIALAGRLYIWIYFRIHEAFKQLKMNRFLKPALGGLLVGAIGFFYPQVLGMGYGWVQQALHAQMLWKTMLIIAFLKMIATSLTINSGGSGGVFAPSLFIGGLLGGAFGQLAAHFFPGMVSQPTAFVVVGMGGFFAGVAKVPIASLVMVSEMTRGYGLLVPMMLVAAIAYLLTRHKSIYAKQVETKKDSPAHFGDFTINVLEELKVADAMVRRRNLPRIPYNAPLKQWQDILANSQDLYFPVVNQADEIVGVISFRNIRTILFEDDLHDMILAADLMTELVTVKPGDSLYTALEKFIESDYGTLLVVDEKDPNRVVGLLRHEDVISAYNREVLKRKFGGSQR
jgi:CIC family chloride channel protein